MMGKVVVTGGAGFIGSHVVDALLSRGLAEEVVVIDNFSSGRPENLELAKRLGGGRLRVVRADLKDPGGPWASELEGADAVVHMAANPEVRLSVTEPRVHFEENVVATFNLLEASRRRDAAVHLFASSSTVYGDPASVPTREDHPLRPISVYGAAKAACEALYQSYSALYGFRAVAARYANVVGPRLRHGVIYDFIAKLRSNPRELEVLGDGTQRKSYLHVSDAVGATLLLLERARSQRGFDAYNVGNDDWVSVVEIAEAVIEAVGARGARLKFRPGTPDGRGWPGDVKLMLLDSGKLKSLGWRPSMGSREAVARAARELARELGAAGLSTSAS